MPVVTKPRSTGCPKPTASHGVSSATCAPRRGLAPLCALTSHVQSSLPGCPQPVVSRPSHRETPAPHPASLLSRRSRLLHNHATPCCAPLLWATERALRTLPSPRARSRCRRRAARGAGRKGLLFYLSVTAVFRRLEQYGIHCKYRRWRSRMVALLRAVRHFSLAICPGAYYLGSLLVLLPHTACT